MRSSSFFSAQRILVTGATGFLGTHLCRVLASMAQAVHAVSRKPPPGNDGVQWWQGDLSDFATTERLLKKIRPNIIFHLTTHGWGAPGLEHVRPTLHNDLMATVNLLTSATELKVERLILTGSSEEPPSGDPDAIPATPYAAAKWASSTYARMFHRLYLTPVITARIFMTYGPGQPFQKLIPYTICSLLKGEAPKLSNAQRLIDWIYVDDVIQGLLAAAQANDLEGSTLDLGSGSLISVQEVVEQLVGMVKPEIHPSFGALSSRPVAPVRPANVIESYTRTGWKAVTPLAKGLELTVDWYRMQSASSNPEARLQTTPSQDNPSQKHGSWET